MRIEYIFISDLLSNKFNMIILWLHFDTHDSNVSIIMDNEILFSSSEDTFSRIKWDSSAPIKAIKYCLDKFNINPNEIDIIAISWTNFPYNLYRYSLNRILMWYKAFWFRLWKYNKNPIYFLWLNRLVSWFKKKKAIMSILQGFKWKIIFVDHELCHASSALFTSGFDLNDTLSVVIEWSWWDKSASSYCIQDNKILLTSKTSVINSVWYFYDMVVEILWYKSNQDAWKITWLAAYGNYKLAYNIVKKYIYFDSNKICFWIGWEVYRYPNEYKKNWLFPNELSTFSKEDLAAAFQYRFEEVIIEYIGKLNTIYKKNNLVLSWWCFANVKLNQRIQEKFWFKNLYIHPAMSDKWCSLWAALYSYNKYNKYNKKFKDVFLWQEYDNKTIIHYLKENKIPYKESKDIEFDVANYLSENKIIALYKWRIEYWPRALWNRSILYRANDETVHKWLNDKLKRTEFMPFAPIILEEDFKKYFFVSSQNIIYTEEFMTITYKCKDNLKIISPAVVHIDWTARPQIIKKENNPWLYKILKEYKKITWLPVLINTSFNMHWEPIVWSYKDAINTYNKSELDILILNNLILKKY